jgi:hypothetical protein
MSFRNCRKAFTILIGDAGFFNAIKKFILSAIAWTVGSNGLLKVVGMFKISFTQKSAIDFNRFPINNVQIYSPLKLSENPTTVSARQISPSTDGLIDSTKADITFNIVNGECEKTNIQRNGFYNIANASGICSTIAIINGKVYNVKCEDSGALDRGNSETDFNYCLTLEPLNTTDLTVVNCNFDFANNQLHWTATDTNGCSLITRQPFLLTSSLNPPTPPAPQTFPPNQPLPILNQPSPFSIQPLPIPNQPSNFLNQPSNFPNQPSNFLNQPSNLSYSPQSSSAPGPGTFSSSPVPPFSANQAANASFSPTPTRDMPNDSNFPRVNGKNPSCYRSLDLRKSYNLQAFSMNNQKPWDKYSENEISITIDSNGNATVGNLPARTGYYNVTDTSTGLYSTIAVINGYVYNVAYDGKRIETNHNNKVIIFDSLNQRLQCSISGDAKFTVWDQQNNDISSSITPTTNQFPKKPREKSSHALSASADYLGIDFAVFPKGNRPAGRFYQPLQKKPYTGILFLSLNSHDLAQISPVSNVHLSAVDIDANGYARIQKDSQNVRDGYYNINNNEQCATIIIHNNYIYNVKRNPNTGEFTKSNGLLELTPLGNDNTVCLFYNEANGDFIDPPPNPQQFFQNQLSYPQPTNPQPYNQNQSSYPTTNQQQFNPNPPTNPQQFNQYPTTNPQQFNPNPTTNQQQFNPNPPTNPQQFNPNPPTNPQQFNQNSPTNQQQFNQNPPTPNFQPYNQNQPLPYNQNQPPPNSLPCNPEPFKSFYGKDGPLRF